MSESNKPKDLNPYPRGAAGSSVPVLFSLRNVQPLIVGSGAKEPASQSTRGSQKQSEVVNQDAVTSILPELQSQATPPASDVIPPMTSGRTAYPSRISNRVYNATIAVLAVILCMLILRNSSPSTHDKLAKSGLAVPSVPETTTTPAGTTSIPAGLASSTTDAPPFQLSPSAPSTVVESTSNSIANQVSSSGQSQSESSSTSSSSPILLEPSTTHVASSEEEAPSGFMLTPASQDASTQPQVTAKPAFAPTLLEVAGSTTIPTAPQADEFPLALESPTAGSVETNPPQTISNSGSTARPDSTAAQPPQATKGAVPGNQIFDTGVPLTTRDLIALHRTNAANADPQMQNAPAMVQSTAQSIAPSPTTNPAFNQARSPYVPTMPVSGPTSLPVAVPTNPQVLSGQAYPPLSKELNPLTIPAYEQNALNSRNGLSLQNAQNPLLKQPAGNNSNRYQGILIQQPSNASQSAPTTGAPTAPYVPIGPAPTQSGNSVGYPPSN